MVFKLNRRDLMRTGIAAAGAAALPGAAFGQDKYDHPRVTLVVPFDTGGSADRMARVTAPFLSRELGVPVNVINRTGGGGVAGHAWFLSQPSDGSTFLVTAATPHLANQSLMQLGGFAWEDYAFVNGQWRDYYMLSVNAQQPYRTLSELIDGLRVPGQVSAGILRGEGGHLSKLLLMDALGIPEENLRLVSYDGGGGARTALAGNQVAMSIISAQGTEPIRDSVRPLAVFTSERLPEWDAPPILEALAEHGVEMPVLDADVRSVVCHAALAREHPERLAAFTAAYQRALEREDCREALAAAHIGAEWLGIEATTEVVNRNYDVLASLVSRLQD